METLNTVIVKRTSFDHLLALIPHIPDEYQDRISSARALWNSLTLERQRLIYYDIRERLKKGEKVNPNPYFLIDDCHPVPNNWNGKQGINEMMKTTKMVSAKYPCSSRYGIYTAQEARLFQMTDIKPLN
ncbi:MAG: hypothetical protein IKO26_11005 [Paludibacteraceae bacterium]|nr:hypothetical protein [Paludibacteraceae bacterium]